MRDENVTFSLGSYDELFDKHFLHKVNEKKNRKVKLTTLKPNILGHARSKTVGADTAKINNSLKRSRSATADALQIIVFSGCQLTGEELLPTTQPFPFPRVGIVGSRSRLNGAKCADVKFRSVGSAAGTVNDLETMVSPNLLCFVQQSSGGENRLCFETLDSHKLVTALKCDHEVTCLAFSRADFGKPFELDSEKALAVDSSSNQCNDVLDQSVVGAVFTMGGKMQLIQVTSTTHLVTSHSYTKVSDEGEVTAAVWVNSSTLVYGTSKGFLSTVKINRGRLNVVDIQPINNNIRSVIRRKLPNVLNNVLENVLYGSCVVVSIEISEQLLVVVDSHEVTSLYELNTLKFKVSLTPKFILASFCEYYGHNPPILGHDSLATPRMVSYSVVAVNTRIIKVVMVYSGFEIFYDINDMSKALYISMPKSLRKAVICNIPVDWKHTLVVCQQDEMYVRSLDLRVQKRLLSKHDFLLYYDNPLLAENSAERGENVLDSFMDVVLLPLAQSDSKLALQCPLVRRTAEGTLYINFFPHTEHHCDLDYYGQLFRTFGATESYAKLFKNFVTSRSAEGRSNILQIFNSRSIYKMVMKDHYKVPAFDTRRENLLLCDGLFILLEEVLYETIGWEKLIGEPLVDFLPLQNALFLKKTCGTEEDVLVLKLSTIKKHDTNYSIIKNLAQSIRALESVNSTWMRQVLGALNLIEYIMAVYQFLQKHLYEQYIDHVTVTLEAGIYSVLQRLSIKYILDNRQTAMADISMLLKSGSFCRDLNTIEHIFRLNANVGGFFVMKDLKRIEKFRSIRAGLSQKTRLVSDDLDDIENTMLQHSAQLSPTEINELLTGYRRLNESKRAARLLLEIDPKWLKLITSKSLDFHKQVLLDVHNTVIEQKHARLNTILSFLYDKSIQGTPPTLEEYITCGARSKETLEWVLLNSTALSSRWEWYIATWLSSHISVVSEVYYWLSLGNLVILDSSAAINHQLASFAMHFKTIAVDHTQVQRFDNTKSLALNANTGHVCNCTACSALRPIDCKPLLSGGNNQVSSVFAKYLGNALSRLSQLDDSEELTNRIKAQTALCLIQEVINRVFGTETRQRYSSKSEMIDEMMLGNAYTYCAPLVEMLLDCEKLSEHQVSGVLDRSTKTLVCSIHENPINNVSEVLSLYKRYIKHPTWSTVFWKALQYLMKFVTYDEILQLQKPLQADPLLLTVSLDSDWPVFDNKTLPSLMPVLFCEYNFVDLETYTQHIINVMESSVNTISQDPRVLHIETITLYIATAITLLVTVYSALTEDKSFKKWPCELTPKPSPIWLKGIFKACSMKINNFLNTCPGLWKQFNSSTTSIAELLDNTTKVLRAPNIYELEIHLKDRRVSVRLSDNKTPVSVTHTAVVMFQQALPVLDALS